MAYEVIRWMSDDGVSHENEVDAVRRDCVVEPLKKEAERILGIRPSETSFTNGYDGVILHNEYARGRVCKLFEGIEKKNVKYLGYVASLATRLQCISAEGIEYGQPYFVSNPDKSSRAVIENRR